MKVAVLFGGSSAERDVSVASGIQVMKALREAGHTVIGVDTALGVLEAREEARLHAGGVPSSPPSGDDLRGLRNEAALITETPDLSHVDVVFLALHGGTGENGTIQALLDLVGIPYTGSGPGPSANAMDKEIAKRLFCQAGIPTPDWIMAPAPAQEVRVRLGFPVVVKPNRQGSTIGLSLVQEEGELDAAVAEAALYDREVIIEHYVPGRELTVGILEDRPLAAGEIIPREGCVFDYECKYQPGGAEEIFPARLNSQQTDTLKSLALQAHRALKLEGYSRVDFRMDPGGHIWCLEANTLPGMTATSLLPQSARAEGISFPELCDRICRLAVARHSPGP